MGGDFEICDFLIIGGGIAGISAAARLSDLGSVVLLEQETALAHHASGRSAALYEPHYGNPTVVELSLASGDFLRGIDNVLSPRGVMMVGSPETDELARAEAVAMNLDPISFAEATAIVPILKPGQVSFTAYADHAHDIDTDLLIQTFLRHARGQGAQVVTGARVEALAREAGAWTATTARGRYRGRLVINAAGPWVDAVAALAGVAPLGFTPLRRSMARIPAPGGLDMSRWPMMFGAGEGWYAKPDAGALIVSPGEEDPSAPMDAWADDMVLAEGLARYEEMVTEPVTRIIANWAGLRTFSPDRVPVVGFDGAAPDFFWLGGQGGYGFQSSPAISQLVADLIGGRAPQVRAEALAALSPKRFA